MNKQIEIEEMAKIIAQSVDGETLCDGLAGDSSMACFGCDYSEKEYCKHHFESATGLYDKGYRKIPTNDWLTKGISEEQLEREKQEALDEFAERNGYCKASEIFEAIEKLFRQRFSDEVDGEYRINAQEFAKLKKKYEREDDFPNCEISGCEAAQKDCHIGCPYGKENTDDSGTKI